MDYSKTNLKWEDFFATESAELEEKMQSLDMEMLSKSKIRLSLETRILDWNKYESWVFKNLGCASLKPDISTSDLESILENLQSTLDNYSTFEFWGEDLIPITSWEDQLIVFGLQYNENLISMPNHIFILTPPEILTAISKKLSKADNSESSEEENEEIHEVTSSGIEGLSLETKPLTFNFKSPPAIIIPPDQTMTASLSQFTSTDVTEAVKYKSEREIWEFIKERHNEYIFEVRKQFTAYIVLKVDYNNTRVFKMDPDLAKENVNEQLFNYSLREENPFKMKPVAGIIRKVFC